MYKGVSTKVHIQKARPLKWRGMVVEYSYICGAVKIPLDRASLPNSNSRSQSSQQSLLLFHSNPNISTRAFDRSSLLIQIHTHTSPSPHNSSYSAVYIPHTTHARNIYYCCSSEPPVGCLLFCTIFISKKWREVQGRKVPDSTTIAHQTHFCACYSSLLECPFRRDKWMVCSVYPFL